MAQKTVPKPAYRKNKGRLARNFRRDFPLTLLALPGIFLLFINKYLPLYGLILPFKNYKAFKGVLGSDWSGLDNFRFLIKSDVLLRITRNTILYNLAFIVVGTMLSVLVALLLNELGKRTTTVYQTILFIPYFISWVVVSYAMKALLDMEHGVFNRIIRSFGGEDILWYNAPRYWPAIILCVAVWKGLGYESVIYYAALMGVDSEIYEAATIDGAGRFRQAVSISIPMIKGMIILLGITKVGGIINSDFGLFYNVPLNSPLLYETTDVIDTYVYRALTSTGDIGMAAATGLIQSVVGLILVVVTNAIVRKVSNENALF